jgi:arginase
MLKQNSGSGELSGIGRRELLAAAGVTGLLASASRAFSAFASIAASDNSIRLVVRRPVAIVEAPFNLGLRPPSPGKQPGVRRLAKVLREDGLPKAVGAVTAIRVNPPEYSITAIPGDGVRNAKAIYNYAQELAKATGSVLDTGRFPLVLGGDCSILLGNLLALRKRGRYGLVYLDAHSDTDLPAVDHLTSGAGSDLAVATGHGVTTLRNLDGANPLVRPEDTVLFGYLVYWKIKGDPLNAFSLAELRKLGIRGAVERSLNLFRNHGVRGFWIHLDADVLNDTIMSAVDSRHPDGMSWEELRASLHGFLSSELAVGMEVTIYDPDRDPTGKMGRELSQTIASAFRV